MPRRNGAPNYKTDLLIGIVESLKPKGAEGWKRVAVLYQQDSGESVLRDGDDIKRHWTEKLCFKFKKPTGKTGQIETDRIFRCQTIQRGIQAEIECEIMGIRSADEDSDDGEDGDDSEIEATQALFMTPPEPQNHIDSPTAPLPIQGLGALANAVVAGSPAFPANPPAAQSIPSVAQTAPWSSKKTKNAGSAQRGSIVKTLDTVAKALTTPSNTPNNDALLMIMQQHQQFAAQQMQMMMMLHQSIHDISARKARKRKRHERD